MMDNIIKIKGTSIFNLIFRKKSFWSGYTFITDKFKNKHIIIFVIFLKISLEFIAIKLNFEYYMRKYYKQ